MNVDENGRERCGGSAAAAKGKERVPGSFLSSSFSFHVASIQVYF
jgi:hypothetical protein